MEVSEFTGQATRFSAVFHCLSDGTLIALHVLTFTAPQTVARRRPSSFASLPAPDSPNG